MSTVTVSYEAECKYCQTQTFFGAFSAPEGLETELFEDMAEQFTERATDCCFTCYMLHEVNQQ